MCNLYEKNVEVIEMGLKLIESSNYAVNREGDIVSPEDLRSLPARTYPKYAAPVLLHTAEGCSLPLLRWGVKRDVQGKTRFVTNARDNKLASWTWRYCAAQRRCLVPATAYFEWDGPEGGKWEVRFTLKSAPTFWMAGLWDTDQDGTRSFTVVTTTPNEFTATVHPDRMPVILDDEGAREWLGYAPLPADRLLALCRPYAAEAMACFALPPPEKKIKKSDVKAAVTDSNLELGLN